MYIFAIIVKSYRYAMNIFIYYREAVYPYAKMFNNKYKANQMVHYDYILYVLSRNLMVIYC